MAARDAVARVCVVVPSYNHAAFIETALRSIFRQTLQPATLLVIDDGSVDDSPRIIEKVLSDCPFPCELIARENRGLCHTLNEGLAKTHGDYFAYLGSDDLWLPDFLSARVRLLDARPRAALAYGHAFLIDEENRIVDCTLDWADYADGDARRMLIEQTIAPMSPTVAYRRTSLERHGWNESARLEDYDLYLRLCVEGEFAFDARALSAWRRHASNASWNQRMMLDEQLQAQRRSASLLGLSDEELSRLQTRIRFSRAEDFLRIGEKGDALWLLLGNMRGATSARTLARMTARLLVPYSLVRLRMRRAQRRASARYGSLQL